jgi:glycosylphosphatidylinositol transamidase (GPIT) subunit GPI8
LGKDCVLTFLQEQPANMAASAKGFKALFRRYAEHGRQGLTEEQFHLANREESIWEFRQQFPASVYSVSLISADREVSFSGADTTLNTIRC